MGGIYIPWLADAARMTGYPVVEVNGWRTRGHGGLRVVEGVTEHHTATSRHAPGDYPSLGVVTNGHSSLPGPLANLGLGRSGTIYVVAAGMAYHAGASAWAGFYDLNDEFIGIEAENDGVGEPWYPGQIDCYPRLVAANLHYMHRSAGRAVTHRKCALPAGRKIDPTGLTDEWFWDTVRAYLANPPSINRYYKPTVTEPPVIPPQEEDDMTTVYAKGSTKPDIWCFTADGTAVTGRHVTAAEWGVIGEAEGVNLTSVSQTAFDALVTEVSTP